MKRGKPWHNERFVMWDERRERIRQQREAGHTFAYIAGFWNVSHERARQLYRHAQLKHVRRVLAK